MFRCFAIIYQNDVCTNAFDIVFQSVMFAREKSCIEPDDVNELHPFPIVPT